MLYRVYVFTQKIRKNKTTMYSSFKYYGVHKLIKMNATKMEEELISVAARMRQCKNITCFKFRDWNDCLRCAICHTCICMDKYSVIYRPIVIKFNHHVCSNCKWVNIEC